MRYRNHLGTGLETVNALHDVNFVLVKKAGGRTKITRDSPNTEQSPYHYAVAFFSTFFRYKVAKEPLMTWYSYRLPRHLSSNNSYVFSREGTNRQTHPARKIKFRRRNSLFSRCSSTSFQEHGLYTEPHEMVPPLECKGCRHAFLFAALSRSSSNQTGCQVPTTAVTFSKLNPVVWLLTCSVKAVTACQQQASLLTPPKLCRYSLKGAPCLYPPRINGNFSDTYERRVT